MKKLIRKVDPDRWDWGKLRPWQMGLLALYAIIAAVAVIAATVIWSLV